MSNTSLQSILPKKLIEGLNETEKKLLEKVQSGDFADFRSGDEQHDKTENSHAWDYKRIVRAELISWLCTNQDAAKLIDQKGVRVAGIKIQSKLDLSYSEVIRPFTMISCVVNQGIDLSDSRVFMLSLADSFVGSINAKNCKTMSDITLSNIEVCGEVSFLRAHIAGNFECINTSLKNPNCMALIADGVTIEGNVTFEKNFYSEGEVRFLRAKIGGIFDCHNATFKNMKGEALFADGSTIGGSIFLCDNFLSEGRVRFLGAKIGGGFYCYNATFKNPFDRTLSADNAKIEGNVILGENFNSEGEVRFIGAKIGGNFNCCNATFKNMKGEALIADGSTIEKCLFLRDNFYSEGEVRFLGAKIGGDFSCRDATFKNPNGNALSVDGLVVKGSVYLRGNFHSEGEVRFPSAKISGGFECNGATFKNPNKIALNAYKTIIDGNVYNWDNFYSEGEIRFIGAKIGGDFDCSNSTFKNSNDVSLSANGIKVGGCVYLGGNFHSEGEIRFPGGNIGGNFFCNGVIKNINGMVLIADGIIIKGNVFLRDNFHSEGEIRFPGAKIEGTFDCSNAILKNPEGVALNINTAKIENTLICRELINIIGIVDFEHTQVRQLFDDQQSWPLKDCLLLDGFIYDSFVPNSPSKASDRIQWLSLQPSKPPKPQTYEQLAKIYKSMGHETDACTVLIEKNKVIRQYGDLSRMKILWSWFLEVTIGYGYNPWNVFKFIIPSMLIGYIIFLFSDLVGVMQLVNNNVVVDFNPLVYSIDTFIPFIDLHQESNWMPNTKLPFGFISYIYLLLHISAGWLFSTLIFVALTGLIRKEY